MNRTGHGREWGWAHFCEYIPGVLLGGSND